MKCPTCGADDPEGATFCNLSHVCLFDSSAQADQRPAVQVDEVLFPPELRQAQPTRPDQRPCFGYPPQGGPVSDAYARRVPPPTGPTDKWDDSGTWKVVPGAPALLAVMVGLVAAFFHVICLSSKPRTYTSKTSALTFRYPGNWKTVPSDTSFQLPFLYGEECPDYTYEVDLADSTGPDGGFALWAVHLSDVPQSDWRKGKTALLNSTPEELQELTPGWCDGIPKIAETTISGSEAITMDAKLLEMGNVAHTHLAMIYNDDKVYVIALAGKYESDTSKQWKEILESLIFKS